MKQNKEHVNIEDVQTYSIILKEKNHRKSYLDALRILAIFLVIFNHLKGYTLYMNCEGTTKTWIYMFITMFTRMNVPIFLMISGALLLGKKEKISEILKKD